jgi:lysozyme
MTPIKKKLAALGIIGAISLSATDLIIPSEGEVRKVYLDPARILTSCFGHTGPELQIGQTFTEQQCLDQLATDLHKHNRQLMSVVKVPLSEGEHAAYLSFVYNVGIGKFKGSAALAKLNAGRRIEACHQLMRWVYTDGKVLNGLRTRREKERKVCLKDLTK